MRVCFVFEVESFGDGVELLSDLVVEGLPSMQLTIVSWCDFRASDDRSRDPLTRALLAFISSHSHPAPTCTFPNLGVAFYPQKLHCLWSERGCIHAIKKHNNCVTFFQRRSGSLELLEDIGECLHALLESFCRLLAEINELSHSYCMGIYATRANFSRIICQMAKRSPSEIAVLHFGCARILSLALVERADKM